MRRAGGLITLLLVACSKASPPPPPTPTPTAAPTTPTVDAAKPSPPDATPAPSRSSDLTVANVHLTVEDVVAEDQRGKTVTLHATVTPHRDLGVKQLVELSVVCQIASGEVIDSSAGIATGKVGEARDTSFTFFDEGPLEDPPRRCEGRVSLTAPGGVAPPTELERVCWTAGKEAPGACTPPLR